MKLISELTPFQISAILGKEWKWCPVIRAYRINVGSVIYGYYFFTRNPLNSLNTLIKFPEVWSQDYVSKYSRYDIVRSYPYRLNWRVKVKALCLRLKWQTKLAVVRSGKLFGQMI